MQIKAKARNQLDVKNGMRYALFSTSPKIDVLVNEVQQQVSHQYSIEQITVLKYVELFFIAITLNLFCTFFPAKYLMGHKAFAQQKMGCERKKVENH